MTSQDLTPPEASFRAVTCRSSNWALNTVLGAALCLVCLLAEDGDCVFLERLKIILQVFTHSVSTTECTLCARCGKAAVNLKVRIPALSRAYIIILIIVFIIPIITQTRNTLA